MKKQTFSSARVAPQSTPTSHVLSRVAAFILLLACTGCQFALNTGFGSVEYSNDNFGGLGLHKQSSDGSFTRFGTSGDVFENKTKAD